MGNGAQHGGRLTSAAPLKPLPPVHSAAESLAAVCHGNGQNERFKNRSISTNASVLQVFKTVPSGLMRASGGMPFKILATGSLHVAKQTAVEAFIRDC